MTTMREDRTTRNQTLSSRAGAVAVCVMEDIFSKGHARARALDSRDTVGLAASRRRVWVGRRACVVCVQDGFSSALTSRFYGPVQRCSDLGWFLRTTHTFL